MVGRKEIELWRIECFPLIERAHTRFWNRITTSTVEPESLCVLRVITGLYLLVLYLPQFAWLGSLPNAFFHPPALSPAVLFSGFPDTRFLLAVDLLSILAAVCLTTGIKSRWSARVLLLLQLGGLTFQYSAGRIEHSILLYVLLGAMSASNWGCRLALLPDRERDVSNDHKILALLGFVLCFAFFTAGFEKALAWLTADPARSGSANWFYTGYYLLDRRFVLAPWASGLPFTTFKFMDYCAVAIELSPLPALLYSRRSWHGWLLIACIFHLINALVLNIGFLYNIPIYLAFLDFSRAYYKAKLLLSVALIRALAVGFVMAVAVIRIWRLADGKVWNNLLFNTENTTSNMLLAGGLWLILAGAFGWRLWTGRSKPAQNKHVVC